MLFKAVFSVQSELSRMTGGGSISGMSPSPLSTCDTRSAMNFCPIPAVSGYTGMIGFSRLSSPSGQTSQTGELIVTAERTRSAFP